MKDLQLCRLAALALFAPAAILSTTIAEAQLEEIIVTAAYREQGLQDVPVSISAVTGEMMAEAALQSPSDIQFLVPNFTLTESGISTNTFIRGIGSGINQGFEQSVGTYVDGVYRSRGQQFRAPFLDTARVEVLRGPQSILFGKNSVAGALNITSATPTDEFEGSFMLSNEFENNELIAEGMLSGPISDRVRYRVAARSRQLDGHMKNLTLDKDEPERDDWAVRGTLEFDVSDNLTATLKAEVGEFDVTGRHIEIINEQPSTGGPLGNSFPLFGFQWNQILQAFGADSSVANIVKDGERSSNGDFSNNESSEIGLTLDWAIGDHNLESITAVSDFEYDEFCDCDFTGAVVFGAALQEKYEQFSQELRLSSPLGDTVDYIAGVYYQTSDHTYADQIIVPGTSVLVPILDQLTGQPGTGATVADTQASRLATVENDVLSAFAQVNWHISDAFTLQLGGRVTNDSRDGARTLSITEADFDPLDLAAQGQAPFIYANLFGITSTNLVAYSQSPDPTTSAIANAFVYYGFAANGLPCSAASDPANCGGALGELPVEGSRDGTKFSPEVKLVWDIGDDALLYFSWSEGFKSGSFDFRANNKNFYATTADSFEFEDEEATNFELGGKFTLSGGALELNMAAFVTEYDDLQISIFDGSLGFNVGNAASADIWGVEIDWRWAATERLTITGGLAKLDFEFTDFTNGQCYFGAISDVTLNGVELCDYTGNSNQMVSDYQGNITFDYRMPIGGSLEMRAMVDLFFTDDYDASATFDPALVQDSYSMTNARLSFGDQDGRWQIAVLAKNLSDEKILTFGGDAPLSGTSFYAKSNYAFYNPGRTISLQGLVRF
jgi:iron complex outermembrane receptor protein